MKLSEFKAGFIAQVSENVEEGEELIAALGYIGDSASEGNFRLYASVDLNNHIEIPEKAVVHVERLKGSEFGAVMLWMKRSEFSASTTQKVSLKDMMRGTLTDRAGDRAKLEGLGELFDGTLPGMPSAYAFVSPYADTPVGVTPFTMNCHR